MIKVVIFQGADESQSWSKMSELEVSHHPNQSDLHLIVEATLFCNGRGNQRGSVWEILAPSQCFPPNTHLVLNYTVELTGLTSDGFFI